ncbi:hypothetical protein LAZ67_12002070 [Cordylochernes scorpioides]|uniref:CCHC-type domain-containing protein n=1 Tax=Cordylochernes scorpioides TaxID=51811 RepID=A0ABY6L2C2_9ARAC|nr:hypothetical protein LAZ67_12002070 [Cordylochernes scorpioides]
MTVRQIEETLGIPKTTVDRIMREHLGLRKLSACWVPKLLTPDQKAVRRKKIVYHQDNALSHRSLQAMATIYDSGFELLPNAPYSPDLAPFDFNLFPHLKKSLSGIQFRSDEEVIDAVTSFFESLETSFFLEALKKPVEELDTTDLNFSALQLEDLCRDLHEWDEKVTEAMLDEEVTEAEQDKEYDECLKYDSLIKRLREELEKERIMLRLSKILKERFGRDNMLIKVYVRDLLWLVIQSAQERKINFKDLTSVPMEDVLISWQCSKEPEDLESLMKFLCCEVNQTKDREMDYNKHSDSLAQPTQGKIGTKKISFNARREVATTYGFMHSNISPTLREKFKCIFCYNGHPSQDCRKGMKMGMDQKNEKFKSYNRCFKCLLPGHKSRQCKKKVCCDFCKRDGHYAIMCRGADHAESERKSPQRQQNSTPTPAPKHAIETLLVKVWGPKGSKVVRAVIDSGSSQSYILEHIVKDLGVPIMGEVELDHEIFGGIRCISCPASATNQIARCIRKPTFGSWAREFASKKIQLSAFKAESDVVELLLGADINPKIATANMIILSDDLIARETLLGWVVQGKTEGKFPDKNHIQVHNSMQQQQQQHSFIRASCPVRILRGVTDNINHKRTGENIVFTVKVCQTG